MMYAVSFFHSSASFFLGVAPIPYVQAAILNLGHQEVHVLPYFLITQLKVYYSHEIATGSTVEI